MTFEHNGNTYIKDGDNQVYLKYIPSCDVLYIPKYALYNGKQYLVTGIKPGEKTVSSYVNVETDGRKRPKYETRYYDVKINVFGKMHNCVYLDESTKYFLTTINFHDAIRVIGDYAFSHVDSYGSLTLNLPQSLKIIGNNAFAKCKNLEIDTFPDSLITIGDYAFYGCEQIHSLVIPDSVSSIGTYAFCNCSKLKQITIGSGVKTIGEKAFANCRDLKVVHIYNDPFEIMVASSAFPYNAQIIYHKPDEPRRKYISDEKKKALSILLGLEKFIVSNNSTNTGQITDSNDRGKELPAPVIDLDKLIDAVVADGVITDKERSVILKKAKAAGYDVDEVEILLDGKLAEKQNNVKVVAKELKKTPAKKEPATKIVTPEEKSAEGGRSYSKYAVNGEGSYGKGRMVEAVVKKYVELNPGITVQKLKEVFPERLQGSNFIKDSSEKITDMKRYYESALPGGAKFYISNQWGVQTDGFVAYVNENIDGITVTKV